MMNITVYTIHIKQTKINIYNYIYNNFMKFVLKLKSEGGYNLSQVLEVFSMFIVQKKSNMHKNQLNLEDTEIGLIIKVNKLGINR